MASFHIDLPEQNFFNSSSDATEPILVEPSRAEPSRAEPSRAEPSRAEPSLIVLTFHCLNKFF